MCFLQYSRPCFFNLFSRFYFFERQVEEKTSARKGKRRGLRMSMVLLLELFEHSLGCHLGRDTSQFVDEPARAR